MNLPGSHSFQMHRKKNLKLLTIINNKDKDQQSMINRQKILNNKPTSQYSQSGVWAWCEEYDSEVKMGEKKIKLFVDIYNEDSEDYDTIHIDFNAGTDEVIYLEDLICGIRSLYRERYGNDTSREKDILYYYIGLKDFESIINQAASICPDIVRDIIPHFNHCSKKVKIEIVFEFLDLVVRHGIRQEEDCNDFVKKIYNKPYAFLSQKS